MEIEHVDTEEWNRVLPESGFEVFHTAEALEVVDRHTQGDLELLVGYKGDRPVALFPLVVQRRAFGKAVLSPPPSMGIPRLGPLVMPASPKQRKREKLNRRFIGEVLSEFGVEKSNALLRVICPPSHEDPRPFSWEGFDTEPAFTYSLETTDTTPEELLKSFSKSLRREIRDGMELDLSVSIGDAEDATAIHKKTRTRYQEQGREYPLDGDYVRDLTATLSESGRCRVYTARSPEGEFLSGITVLYSNDAAYFWQGGARTTHENVSINSLVHWRILEDIIENPPLESVTRYDLMGANTERLCRYKSKFGAELVPYYVAESSGTGMDLAKKAYQLVGK